MLSKCAVESRYKGYFFFEDYFVGFIVVLHTLNPVFKFLI